MTETLRSAAWLLALSWRQNRAKTAIALVLVLGNAIAAPLMALALKWLTNAAVAGDGDDRRGRRRRPWRPARSAS